MVSAWAIASELELGFKILKALEKEDHEVAFFHTEEDWARRYEFVHVRCLGGEIADKLREYLEWLALRDGERFARVVGSQRFWKVLFEALPDARERVAWHHELPGGWERGVVFTCSSARAMIVRVETGGRCFYFVQPEPKYSGEEEAIVAALAKHWKIPKEDVEFLRRLVPEKRLIYIHHVDRLAWVPKWVLPSSKVETYGDVEEREEEYWVRNGVLISGEHAWYNYSG